MKRLIAFSLALLIFVLPVQAAQMSYFDYTDDISEDGSLIYYFQELSLRLPADWRGKVIAVKNDSGTSFYQKASYEKYQEEGLEGGGFLFMLGASVNSSFSELPAFEYLGFSEESAMNYYLALPTDYPAYNDKTISAEYDAMYEQIDFVVANAVFYSDQRNGLNSLSENSTYPDVAEVPSQAEDNTAFSPAQARYQFEHRMMPEYFYDRPNSVLNGIKEVGIYLLWKSVCTENGIDPTYPAEDYVEHWYSSDDDTIIVQIELPQPDADTLCYRIYFVYNAETGNAGYYTIEYESFLGDSAFLCGWTAEHEHINYDSATLLDKTSDDYQDALSVEVKQIAELAGISTALTSADISTAETADVNLSLISCPEQGFTTMTDSDYRWEYEEGTGIYIYTDHEGSIPYVIVYRNEDLIAEPLEYIKEQFTPRIEAEYGDDLAGYVEYEIYDIGGKQLPAGLYTYRLQGYLIDMLRIYDSTGSHTVTYTAKYIKDEGDAALAALDTAIRNYKAD